VISNGPAGPVSFRRRTIPHPSRRTSLPKTIHELESAPKAVGPYSAATEANGFVFLSGQVGLDPATGSVVGGGVAQEAHQAMTNISAMLAELGLSIADVVKTTIFLRDIADFSAVNDVYAGVVGDAKPARTTVQAGALPLGVAVEIEVVAAR
jgi:2-iminobutanoate/2-iminopropanoate deaminase